MAEKKKVKKEKIDPYFLSNGKLRSEFSPDFEEKRSRVITPEGLYGTASGKTMFESPIVDPDTSMMQNMAKGGSVMVKTKLGKNKITKLY